MYVSDLKTQCRHERRQHGETESLRDSDSEWPGTFEQPFEPLVMCARFSDVSN